MITPLDGRFEWLIARASLVGCEAAEEADLGISGTDIIDMPHMVWRA